MSLGASIPRRATLARSAATCTRAGAVTAGQVCIDSVHEGSRQMYVIDAAEALNAWIEAA